MALQTEVFQRQSEGYKDSLSFQCVIVLYAAIF